MIKLYYIYIYISMLACMCLVPTAINDTCAQVTFWHRLEHLLVFATFPRVQIWDLGSRSRPLGSGGCFFVVYVIALHFFCSRKLSENQISAANFYLKHEQNICHMSTKIQEILPKKFRSHLLLRYPPGSQESHLPLQWPGPFLSEAAWRIIP